MRPLPISPTHNLTGANLTNADLGWSTLRTQTSAGAVVAGARFRGTTSSSFPPAQLYSTASYKAKNLSGNRTRKPDSLTGWDFHDRMFTNADLGLSPLTTRT